MFDKLVVYENGKETARIGYSCGFHSRYTKESKLRQLTGAACNWRSLWKKEGADQIRDLFFATGAPLSENIEILAGKHGGGAVVLKWSISGWIPTTGYAKPLPF